MSGGDDWRVGEPALFVGAIGGRKAVMLQGHTRLRVGGIYTVSEVVPCPPWTALVFDGHLTTHWTEGWSSASFRKLPGHTPDEFDHETIALLAGKPTHLPA